MNEADENLEKYKVKFNKRREKEKIIRKPTRKESQ